MKTGIGRTAKLAAGVSVLLMCIFFALKSAALIEFLGLEGFGKRDAIRLGAYEGDVGALQWIAKEKGFFGKVGLDVDLSGFVSGKEAFAALKAGKIDVATASEFVTVSHSLTEPDLNVIGSIAYYRNKNVVARKDSGIATPADLRGKRIGVTRPSGAEYSLYVFLALNRLTADDVTLVGLTPAGIVEAIAAKTIDAAITWEPHVQALQEHLGSEAVTFQGDGFDSYLLLVSRPPDNTRDLKPAMKKLLRGLLLAEEWIGAHPEEAQRYVAERFKLSPAYVASLWKRMQLEVTLPQELLVAMDAEARWLSRTDKQTSIPNYANMLRGDELRLIKPAAVTIFTGPAPATAAGR